LPKFKIKNSSLKILNMKKLIVLSVLAVFFSLTLLAQAPPAPPSSASNGGGPVGGSAPIGSGVMMLLTMGAGYAIKKLSDRHFASR
jgi:hypothetical protein